jgi:hypothetical protein
MGLLSDYISPLTEGFDNPTMANVFKEILKVTPVPKSKSSRGPKTDPTTGSSGSSCPPASSVPSTDTATGTSATATSTSATSEKIAFLKSILTEQRATADSLMESAKKIGPVIKKITAKTAAYDAAFESDITAPLPNTSGSLQGFTIFFFILSFLSLAIVASVLTNQATGSYTDALKTFGSFFLVFIVAIGIIIRLG